MTLRDGTGVGLAVVLASGEALADRAMQMNARETFAAGRYEDALGLLAKLYAETLHRVYLRNIEEGQAAR